MNFRAIKDAIVDFGNACVMVGAATFVVSLMLVPLYFASQSAKAQGGNQLQFVPLGYQQLTSLGAAASLTVPARATRVVITCEAQAIRYRDDGVAPTATVGMPLAVGVSLTYDSTASAIQIIEQTSGAKCNMLYYR